MFRPLILSFIVVFSTFGLGLSSVVQAEEQQTTPQTITLQVENMTCGSCPFTVKMALKQVDGVEKVIAKYEGRGEGWAKVTFNPNKADVESLVKATTNAGYPSHL